MRVEIRVENVSRENVGVRIRNTEVRVSLRIKRAPLSPSFPPWLPSQGS